MKSRKTTKCADKKKPPTRVRRQRAKAAEPKCQSAKTAEVKEGSAEPVASLDPQAIRHDAVNLVLRAVPKIAQALVKQAEKGGHLPAKFLFDFAGIIEPSAAKPAEDEESLSAMLLQALRQSPTGETPANCATSAANSESVNVNS
ncbi:MAG: hypothetical protein ACE14M_00350 [Terriglobales bacterium]